MSAKVKYKEMKRVYYRIRCRLGRPVCYRDYQDDGDWWYAICKYCHRQAESVVHEGRLLSERW